MKKRKTPSLSPKRKTPVGVPSRPSKRPAASSIEKTKPTASSGEPEVRRAIPLDYVITDEVDLRSAPDLSAPKLTGGLLRQGTVVKIAPQDWWYVEVERPSTASGVLRGWVPNALLRRSTTAQKMAPPLRPASAKVVKVKTIADGVTIFKLESGEAVFFTSDLDVDADGCPMAYGPGNTGLDHNGNAQTPVSSGNWNPSVLVLDNANQPVKQKDGDPAPGFFICKSSLQDTSKPVTDPRRYVDALTTPFIVLPGGSAGPAKTGDAALVIDMRTSKRIKCLVADAGPSGKTGEASMLVVGVLADDLTPKQIVDAAKKDRLKGLHCNPRNGGLNGPADRKFRYVVFPGTTMRWPQTIGAIEARVDGALAPLTPEQIVAITT
jgi:hypothetical protein